MYYNIQKSNLEGKMSKTAIVLAQSYSEAQLQGPPNMTRFLKRILRNCLPNFIRHCSTMVLSMICLNGDLHLTSEETLHRNWLTPTTPSLLISSRHQVPLDNNLSHLPLEGAFIPDWNPRAFSYWIRSFDEEDLGYSVAGNSLGCTFGN